jgi:two-component system sensor histidine kinase RegB
MNEERITRSDPVGLAWLITVRWTTLVAGIGAVVAGRRALEIAVPVSAVVAELAGIALTNLWLTWRVRRRIDTARLTTIAGVFVCTDVLFLSWLLLKSGGVLNPASVFFLVEIVVAALVLGRRWTWIVTALSVIGYGTLFLSPTSELEAAQGMHPEIALHMHGMWLAFGLTAIIIAVLVTRLVIAVERRDRALEGMRERTTRATRMAGLATLATGAAHELSTPLATIAIAARELEHTLQERHSEADVQEDARLIRAETDRCRQILEHMSGRSGEPAGERPRSLALAEIVNALQRRLSPSDWDRVDVTMSSPATRVVWPINVVARALGNVLQNALQASAPSDRVRLEVRTVDGQQVRMIVTDRGPGMPPEQLARAGEPFFTTKAAGVGTGLGLFVARSSAEQLGGELSLSSTIGHGTSVTIMLPFDVVGAEATRNV